MAYFVVPFTSRAFVRMRELIEVGNIVQDKYET